MPKIFIGIDTSNYTTSFSACSSDGRILCNIKKLLPVKNGERGLRQSDAVFAHIKNLSIINEEIKKFFLNDDYEVIAIGCSAYPRNVEGSYMPCFLVGESFAENIGAINKVPCYKFSHQGGHIRAALYSSNAEISGEFISFHVSGGTTEIIKVCNECGEFKTEILGGSVDLHIGQAIDRIGVKMGLNFPCGKEMESLALKNVLELPQASVCVKGLECNISGLENKATELFNKTENKELVSAFVFEFIGKTLEKLTLNLRNLNDLPIVYAGGVMSNSIICNRLKNKFKNVYFAKPEFSTDNACGIALLTREKYLNNN